MQYISTRGNSSVSASEALVLGLATDGGLYVPEHFPVARSDWRELSNLSYAELAAKVLRMFFPQWTEETCRELCEKAYKGTFTVPGMIRIRPVGENRYFTELFHGRTLAFKDMALSLFPHLLQQAKKDLGAQETTLILTATSGDTGKAALEGFRDVVGTHILVFYPEDGVSPMQKAQMQTQQGSNVHVAGINGNFDDAQSFLKNVFEDPEMRAYAEAKGIRFSSANSINVGRLIPQIVYYIRTYTELLRKGDIVDGEKIDVAVPTGNFGNILAGYFAKKLGLPIDKLICASNENHVLADFFETGIYDRRREFKTTLSPSMDILISSNFERFLYYILDEDTDRVRELMEELKEKGVFKLSEDELSRTQDFIGGWIDDFSTTDVITATYRSNGYLTDPHTAVAVGVTDNLRKVGKIGSNKLVIMATAHPYKFPDAVAASLSLESGETPYDTMWVIAKSTNLPIPCSFLQMAELTPRFTETVEADGMAAKVRSTIDGIASDDEASL